MVRQRMVEVSHVGSRGVRSDDGGMCAAAVTATTPQRAAARIDHLDLLRGVATLGILPMNVVAFALADPAYYRLDADGIASPLDTAVGVVGEVVFDQKMMGLFSLLFGASIVLFVERVGARRRHPVLLSLWRNLLLLGIGLVHMWFWAGDILTLYALCAPVLLALRKLPPRVLMALGSVVYLSSAGLAVVVQAGVGDPAELGWFWTSGDLWGSDAVEAWILYDGYARALGMMLIGVALYRTGVLAGRADIRRYRQMAVVGLAVGLPFALAGVLWQLADDFSYRIALTSGALNTVGTIPMTLGYVGLLMCWSLARPAGLAARIQGRLRAVGRMALTNYLAQTTLGLVVLSWMLSEVDLTRSALVWFVVAVWLAELAWSAPWLARFTNGPVEWLWRVATYLRPQPLRTQRPTPDPA
jgi:uncharacterized protein